MLLNVRAFVMLRPGGGLTSFNKDNSSNFPGEKKYYKAFRGVHFLRLCKKKLNAKPRTRI